MGKEIAIFHNRRKYINRLVVLYFYTQIEHCSLPWRWKRMGSDCCGNTQQLWRENGRFPGVSAWPLNLAVVNHSACGVRGLKRKVVDLRNVTNLRHLGILRLLPPEAQQHTTRWLRIKG